MTRNPSDELRPGLYERVVTRGLAKALERYEALSHAIERKGVEPTEAHLVLARHLAQVLQRAFAGLPGSGTERRTHQVALYNRVLEALAAEASESLAEDCAAERVVDELEELLALAAAPQAAATPAAEIPERPGVPLTTSALLVNARDEHRIGHEISRELASADRVDLICSFVKLSGFRILRHDLARVLEQGRPIRLLTTAYLGATQPEALDALAELGVEIRVSYDTRRTRLHAKAWLFHRGTGYSTAFIGSSNLSSSALVDGLEWNVRLAAVETPGVFEKFEAAFESYWQDPEFEPYERRRFEEVAAAERRTDDDVDWTAFGLRPYPHQELILEQLDAEREVHDRHWNLVVAATGTGKTVVAALDFKRLRRNGRWPRLLFVAHRKEILQQARRIYRAALGDGSFGELYVDDQRPQDWQHVFASIQSLSRLDLQETLARNAFEVVVVDEFHHAPAESYTTLLETLRQHAPPKELLGLTATPERADGLSVLQFFDDRVAAELRLWDALERGLLCPFQYFGHHDDVDLSQLRWSRGGYQVSDLENVYTGNDLRVQIVVRALREAVADVRKIRAFGFCVSVAHAKFMAERFSGAGIPAEAVSGQTPRTARDDALRRLRAFEVNVLFTVDLFNEGVDVPEVDTILFLRPTESATVFLQQLGRGLRLAEDKECLTVLDFIGKPRRQFRFDLRYRGILGGTRREIARQVQDGFPVLPPGCSIQLDREASRVVLSNIEDAVGKGNRGLARDLVEHAQARGAEPTLGEFLEENFLDLPDVYRSRTTSWTLLRRLAGLDVPAEGPHEDRLLKALPVLVHLDDRERLETWSRLLQSESLDSDSLEPGERALLRMLHFALWKRDRDLNSLDLAASLRTVRKHPAVVDELQQLFAVLEDRIDHVAPPVPGLPPDVPLRLHAHYTLDEIRAALGQIEPGSYSPLQAGVSFARERNIEILVPTLNKTEKDYSPRTMYRDYAISPDLFHWESPHTTRAKSKRGRRYQEHAKQGVEILLFVRRRKQDARRLPETYVCLGFVDYVRHEGERPMAVIWRLRCPMPMWVFREARLAAA